MPGPDGRRAGIAVVVFDVTALARAREDAVEANRAKDDFIAMLGHELRNPLAPITTALHLLRARAGDAYAKERGVIERQVNHMTRLVNDLLDVARITRGDVELRKGEVEISRIVADAVETASPLLEQKGHRLKVAVPSDGLCVNGDASRLAQIVSNLIINAAKFTPDGGFISVEATATRGMAELVVGDNGIGMSEQEIGRVFELFLQGDQANHRPHGGLGLGLAIARNLARLHGGSIEARSGGIGMGSTFTVCLPLHRELVRPIAVKALHDESPAEAASLLIVDDNVDGAHSLAEVMRLWGCDVHVAHDGPEALRILQRQGFDAAILDIGLPGMDGYELAETIRRDERLAGMRLFAVTGYGQAEDKERSRACGFEAHLVKPVELAVLRDLLACE
jgi:CheY-like chemotaxis protein/nitrogen-specific signal transduction histidine kinase